jgi:methyl-accepting chemotaxis protein
VKLTLRLKLIGGFAIAALVTLLLGTFAMRSFSDSYEKSDTSDQAALRQVEQVAAIENAFLVTGHLGTKVFESLSDPAQMAEAMPLYVASMTDETDKLMAFADTPMSPAARDLYNQAVDNMSLFNHISNLVFKTNITVPNPAAVEELSNNPDVIANIMDRQDQQREVLAKLRAQIQADARSAHEAVVDDANIALGNLVKAVLAAGVILIAFGVWLSFRLVRRLRMTVKVLHQVEGGDLTARFDDAGNDEVGEMARALNTSVATIHDVVRQIAQDADHLAQLAQAPDPDAPRRDSVSSEDASVELATSESKAAELADMAENLDAMIGVFQTHE